MLGQKIKAINVKDLVLWTENPRDPISHVADNQKIVDCALADPNKKWELPKLAKAMGAHYDLSELPTVVIRKGKPVVYDGNRRVILAMIKLGLVNAPNVTFALPDVPSKLPCNVCTEAIALQNVYRKHADTGSWNHLERDMFSHKYLNQEKSALMMVDEVLDGFIADNSKLNQRFVRDEVLNSSNLSKLGIRIEDDRLLSIHTKEELFVIFKDILHGVESGEISTRKRAPIERKLSADVLHLISRNQDKSYQTIESASTNKSVKRESVELPKRQGGLTPVTRKETVVFFGRKLALRPGDVNNLYRAISDLSVYYNKNKDRLSDSFTGLLRMSLRLLVETAARDLVLPATNYVGEYGKAYFTNAKKLLNKDEKTLLASQYVKEESFAQLLHTGAHNYSSSCNYHQTEALSLIIGAMLLLSHGKN